MPPRTGRVCFLLLLLTGCHRSPPPAPSPSLDTIARAYVRLALALGERDPDSLDFSLAPPALRDEVHRAYPPLDAIARNATLLAAQLRTLPSPEDHSPRAAFLTLQLAAVAARVPMLEGHPTSFDAEARALFATIRLPDTAAERSARQDLRARIATLLPPAPGHTTLANRYAAYNARFAIPPERLAAAMNAALAACRQRTREHLALPPDESVELAFVHHQPWSAFSRYLGHAHSLIQINLDQPLTPDDALELACHEGYPGHHVFNTLRDSALVQRARLPEALVQPTFSPQAFVAEAAAAYAPRLAFSLADRTEAERMLLFPLAGLPPQEAARFVLLANLVRQLDSAAPAIARDYLDGHLDFARAGQQLATEALMAHPDATLLYLNEYRSYMLAYTDGPRRLAAIASEHPGQEWDTYEHLIHTLDFQFTDSIPAKEK